MGSASLAGMFKGWTNGERAFAVGLTFAIVILLLWIFAGYLYCQEGYYDAQGAPDKDGYDYIPLWDVVAQWTMAIAAIVLFVWTKRTLDHTRITTAAALKASTTANEHAVRSQRGWIHTVAAKMEMTLKPTSGRTEQIWHVHYSVENIGQGPAMIIGTYVYVFAVPKAKRLTPVPMSSPLVGRSLILKAGGKMASKVKEGADIQVRTTPIPVKATDRDLVVSGEHKLIFAAVILYRTAYDTHHIAGATFEAEVLSAGEHMMYVDDPEWEHVYDIEVEPPFNFLPPEGTETDAQGGAERQ